MEQGKTTVNKEDFELKEFSQEIIGEVMQTLKPGERLKFHYDGAKQVVQDKKILRNILLNLLSNAIRYSGEEKPIQVSIECFDNLVITVKDAGIGIPEEEQKNIFGKFFRALNVGGLHGTGLGLNIVKKYVELLGGDRSFTSKRNEGTASKVRLP